MPVIKKINTYDIGADAENIDWGNSTLKNVIGENIDTSTSIADQLQELKDIINTLTSSNNAVSAGVTEAAIEAFNDFTENFNIDEFNNKINLLMNRPIAVNQVRWNTGAMRNLRDILGACDNMPYATIRDWLENLSVLSKNPITLVWHSLENDINENNNSENENEI